MRPLRLRAPVVAALALLAGTPASAWHRHHAAATHAASPVRVYGPGYYPAGGWQAEVIAHATVRMQAAPGVTNELSPDAKETATGGPSGGVPEFSGN